MKRLSMAIAMVLLTLAVWLAGSGVEASVRRALRIPVLDPVAGPTAPVRALDIAALRSEVASLIRGAGLGNSDWGVLAVSLERGDTLLALNPDRPLAPASNQKLFTSAAALHHLGPDYRFSTFLLAEGEVENGVLNGNLILYGTGDPAISDQLLESSTAPWIEFAGALAKAGVHTVSGDIVGDASFFRGPIRSPSWSSRYLDHWYAAPVSALTFAENVVRVHISGGPQGSAARIQWEPQGARLPVLNRSVSVPGSGRGQLVLARAHPDSVIELRGQIGTEAASLSRRLTVPEPSRYAASVFKAVLENQGIRVLGEVSVVEANGDSRVARGGVVAPALQGTSIRTIAVHRSPPLRELLQVLNKESHNLYAEVLMFTLGRVTSGDASFLGGGQALRAYLTDVVGVNPEELRIEDGSGLSRANRASPAAFVRLLSHMATAENAEAFWASLPEAGNRRELRRMYQTSAAGNLRAKTGTINNVSALSGIVRTADGEPVLFSILSNNVRSSGRAKRVEDGIGVELASFVRPPEVVASN